MADRVEINSELLGWARAAAGLSLEAAAKKVGIKPASLQKLEAGETSPTTAQLEKFSRAYRRSLVTFFLSTPPAASPPVEDYRSTLSPPAVEQAPLLEALIRNIRMRQSLVRSLLEDDDDVQERDFVGSRTVDESPLDLANAIRTEINVTEVNQQEAGNTSALFALLRAKFEQAGVFVILVGDLGSHHTDLTPDTFRGYAISDALAPFVVINDNDAKAAQLFTLVHEAAHIWLGSSGVSTDTFFGVSQPTTPPLEQYCNEVAAQFLMPATAVFAQWDAIVAGDIVDRVTAVASIWHVSRPAAAYRLFRLGRIARPTWLRLREQFDAEWQYLRAMEKEKNKGGGGPSYYVVRRNRLGNSLLGMVRRSLQSGELTYTEASRILDVKPTNVPALLEG